MNKKHSFFASAGPLLLVLFIDGMGLGLVFPILNGLIFDPQSHFLSQAYNTPLMHNAVYGLIVGIFMLCWFFGAAMLGDLSDKIGRKKSLMICLLGAFFSYVVSAMAVIFHSLILLLIGRVIAGFTSGSQPIAQAAIIDLSTPAEKTKNIGYILLAISLGFIFGPLLGGILSDSSLVPWFNFAVPFYFAGLISCMNIVLLWLLFNETFVSKSTTLAINPYQAIEIFISAFKNQSVRNLSIIFFIFIFGWSSFYSFIAMYLLKVYDFTPTQVSLYMAVMGIGFGIGNGYLSNFFAKLFPLRENFIYSTLFTAIVIFLMTVIHSALFSWLMVGWVAIGVSIAYTSILTLFSDQIEPDRQGWVMGITGSVMAFVWAVNGIVIGVAAVWQDKLPLIIAFTSLLLTVVATCVLFKSNHNPPRKGELTFH